MTTTTTSGGSDTSPPAGPPADRRELRRVARFVVVGCTCVLVDFALYTLLAGPLSLHPAKALSYLAGTVVGFFLNKYWTFESRRKSAAEPVVYLFLYAATLGVNVGINGAALDLTGSSPFAFLAATGVTTVLNYVGLRWLAFRTGVREHDAAAAAGDVTSPRRAA